MPAPDTQTLKQACQHLATADPALAKAYSDIGVPAWRAAEPSYETLVRIIAFQQISTKAASTIWSRVDAQLQNDICPNAVLEAEDGALKACGLSRPKVRYFKTIAQAVVSGAIDFERLAASDIVTARKELTSIIGIGAWTADVFLMNALGKLNAFPQGDVGLIEAYRLLSQAETRHDPKTFTDLAQAWQPYRGVAAHLLWGWINAERDKAVEAAWT